MRRSLSGLLVAVAGLLPTLALADGNHGEARREDRREERFEQRGHGRFERRDYGRRFEVRRYEERREARFEAPRPMPRPPPVAFAVGAYLTQLPVGAQTYVVAGNTYAYSSVNYFMWNGYVRSWVVVPAPR